MSSKLAESRRKLVEQQTKEAFELGVELAEIAVSVAKDALVAVCLQTQNHYHPARPTADIYISSYGFMSGGVEFQHTVPSPDQTPSRLHGTRLTRRLEDRSEGIITEVIDQILTESDGSLIRQRAIVKTKNLEVVGREIIRERPATPRTILAMARLAAIQVSKGENEL